MRSRVVWAVGLAIWGLVGCGATTEPDEGGSTPIGTVGAPAPGSGTVGGTGGVTGTPPPTSGGQTTQPPPSTMPNMPPPGMVTGGTGAVPPPPPMMGTGGATPVAGTSAPPPPVMTSGAEPKIPTVTDTCPTLATGNVTVKGQQVQLWVGQKQADKKGAVFFYWHGTGGRSSEATGGLGSAIQEITSEGGLVASFTTTTSTGMNTGNNVWYTGDFEMADVILACAVQQLNIDTRRIYTGGCSAGGLQAGAMVYGRSSYLAGAMPNSGGVVFPSALQDPAHVPALITTHGAMGRDVVIIDFSTTSLTECRDIAMKGGMAVDCDHGGGHCASPSAVKAAQWEFLKAHPFGVDPEPYAGGLPASFPQYCKIIM